MWIASHNWAKTTLMKVSKPSSHKFQSKIESCFIIYHFLQACFLPNFLILLIAPHLPHHSELSWTPHSSLLLIPCPVSMTNLWPKSVDSTSFHCGMSYCPKESTENLGAKLQEFWGNQGMKLKTAKRHWDFTEMRRNFRLRMQSFVFQWKCCCTRLKGYTDTFFSVQWRLFKKNEEWALK